MNTSERRNVRTSYQRKRAAGRSDMQARRELCAELDVTLAHLAFLDTSTPAFDPTADLLQRLTDPFDSDVATGRTQTPPGYDDTPQVSSTTYSD